MVDDGDGDADSIGINITSGQLVPRISISNYLAALPYHQ